MLQPARARRTPCATWLMTMCPCVRRLSAAAFHAGMAAAALRALHTLLGRLEKAAHGKGGLHAAGAKGRQ